jgi:hypothetical protein
LDRSDVCLPRAEPRMPVTYLPCARREAEETPIEGDCWRNHCLGPLQIFGQLNEGRRGALLFVPIASTRKLSVLEGFPFSSPTSEIAIEATRKPWPASHASCGAPHLPSLHRRGGWRWVARRQGTVAFRREPTSAFAAFHNRRGIGDLSSPRRPNEEGQNCTQRRTMPWPTSRVVPSF